MPHIRWTKPKVIAYIRACVARGVPVGKIYLQNSLAHSAGYRLFGSWRTALEAAGLQPGRQRWSRERVVRELKARYPHEKRLWSDYCLESAAVRYYGSWTNALVAAGLKVARPRKPQQIWTKEKVLQGIRERYRQGSLAGTCRKDIALYAVAKRLFGSWLEAVHAAGIVLPLRRRLSATEVLQAIWQMSHDEKTLTSVFRTNPALFNAARKRFGNWQSALVAAGLTPRKRQQWSPHTVIAAIRKRHEQGPPLSQTWRDDKSLFQAGSRCFGSWENALLAAGLAVKRRRSWTKEAVLDALLSWRPPRGRQNLYRHDPGLAGAVHRFFGTFSNAWEELGIDPPSGRWTKQRIIRHIQECYVRGQSIHVRGCGNINLFHAARRQFGSWQTAVEAAGLGSRLAGTQEKKLA